MAAVYPGGVACERDAALGWAGWGGEKERERGWGGGGRGEEKREGNQTLNALRYEKGIKNKLKKGPRG